MSIKVTPSRTGSIAGLVSNAKNAGTGGSSLIVEEIDGSPTVAATELHVPNGSLAVAGTIATLAYVTPANGGLETIQAHGNTGSTETFDLVNGNVHTATLNANCTFTFAGATSGKACSWSMFLTGDGTSVATFPGLTVWPGGVPPTQPIGAGDVLPIVFVSLDGGTVWLGFPTGGTGTGSAIEVFDDGVSLTAALASLDFVGAGVTATVVGDAVEVTIPGGATASDPGIWRPLMDGAGAVITDGTTGEAIMAFGPA